MKVLNLLMWVTQFGLSAMLPPCFLLMLAVRLQANHNFGTWIVFAGGVLGLLISVSTVRANWRAMKKAADEVSASGPAPVSFNDHI